MITILTLLHTFRLPLAVAGAVGSLILAAPLLRRTWHFAAQNTAWRHVAAVLISTMIPAASGAATEGGFRAAQQWPSMGEDAAVAACSMVTIAALLLVLVRLLRADQDTSPQEVAR